ncbi:hypothetical protein HG549_12750 [Pseudomonas sp. SK]|uniref:hypothetical protein n=1 Tax=Pseudomonas sp. SK TaxID=2729423 RepID=UPI001462F616|nr:hypothetical protein [Pseudomonas sp. SK]QJQ20758.1 hypothetical protein HG549_12750 [Pseudomonas sp. SK]
MEQLNRAKRYLGKIERFYSGVISSACHDEDAYLDDMLSFFIHCYHVRDWAIHGAALHSREIDAFINSHESLKICTDLANGSKHCKLTRAPRTGCQPSIANGGVEYSTWYARDGGGEGLKCSYVVMSKGVAMDALQLGRDCIALWDQFLEGSGAR